MLDGRLQKGRNIRVWDDPWIPENLNFLIDSLRINGLEDLMVSDLTDSFGKIWDV